MKNYIMHKNIKNIIDVKKQIYKRDIGIKNIIDYYVNIKYRNVYNPSLNNHKYLTIIACHCNSDLKYNNLLNTIHFLSFDCNDIVIINSKGLPYNNNIAIFCSDKNIQYIEIENDETYDFGKWIYTLKNIDYSSYDYIIFTNDSFIIHKPVHFFYNLTSKINVELYAFNDSTQNCYHYQSYLFSLRKNIIQKFINIFESKKVNIKSQQDVINEIELKMTSFFDSYDCFLKIGNEFYHKNLNIFFTSDYFYNILFQNRLLPFTKIKRIT